MRGVTKLRAWRRYRRMQRLLTQLDRLDQRQRRAAQRSPRAPRPAIARPGRARDLVLLVGSVVVIAGVLFVLGRLFPGLVHAPEDPLGDGVHDPVAATTGAFAFMSTTPAGRPVTYSSCEAIHYVINPAGMPDEVPPLIHQAVEQIGAASGLRFVDDGVTTEPPSPSRPVRQPPRYGQHWAPVLVAWADRVDFPNVADDTEGLGGSTSISVLGRPETARYVTGEVVLFAQGLSDLLHSKDGPIKVRAIITHEFGHVVGLGHVNDPNELMDPVYTGLSGLGPGDRAGLRRLGTGPCTRDD